MDACPICPVTGQDECNHAPCHRCKEWTHDPEPGNSNKLLLCSVNCID